MGWGRLALPTLSAPAIRWDGLASQTTASTDVTQVHKNLSWGRGWLARLAMSAGRSCALLIFTIAISFGYCATISPSLSFSTPNTEPLPTRLQRSSHNTSTVKCDEDYYTCRSFFTGDICRCDEELCTLFGDCCAESQYTHNTTGPEFACVSTSPRSIPETELLNTTGYWMIASCPTDEAAPLSSLVSYPCEARSFPGPPVSDNRTGFVYRNRYCAQCHGVPNAEQITWRSEWRCDNTLQETLKSGNGTIDIALLLDSCYLLFYDWPEQIRSLPLLPRHCDTSVIYTCQPPTGTDTSAAEYRSLSDLCKSELVNVRITDSDHVTLYKNEFCALCSTFGQNEQIYCPLEPMPAGMGADGPGPPPQNTFAIFLDVTGSGKVVIGNENIVVTSTVEQSCGEGKVFDFYSNVCRESLCQPGYIYNGTCLLLSLLNFNCTLIALNESEYQMIANQIIFWTALVQNVSVQGYTSEGNPLVCTNFTTNFTSEVNETITRTLYGYPEAFAILSYVGLSIDVVAGAILLFTYAAFAEMRTFYGKLFMNFVLVLLLGDLTFLLGTALYGATLEDVVCQVVAIVLHYLFLARFVWMSLLSLNVARHFYHAAKFIASGEKEGWPYLILYMAAGWLSPLLVLVVTVPLNHAISGAVGYGVDGLCWMNQTLAIIVSFIVPLATCILFTTGTFLFVCIILVKLNWSRVTKDKHTTSYRNFRVLVAVFFVTGCMWLFGFLALIDSALSWAWYIFIILNTTQAVFLTLAYTCTVKVLRLYRDALRGAFRPRGKWRRQDTLNTEVKQMYSINS